MTLPKNQMDDSSCIIRVLSKVLTLLIDVNQKSNTRQHFVTKFQSSYAPAISIQGYLERINKYAKCSPNCFIVALIYIDRLIEFRNFVLTSLNVHRILITSVLLSTKVFDDEFYKNAYYAKLGGVSTSEMNSLELEFLTLVNFRLYVSTEIFEKYHRELQNFMNVSSSPSQIILSTSSSDANNQQSDKGLLGGGRADGTSNSDTIERNADPTVISPLKPADINVKVPRSYLFNSGVHFPSISSPSINNNINSNIPSSSSSSTTASSTNSSTSSSILPSFNSSTLFHPEDPIVQYPSCRILPWISSCSSASTSSNTILASVSRDSPRSLISYPSSDPSPTLSSSSSSLFSSQNCQENESHLRNELSQDSYPQFQQQSFASTSTSSSSSHPSTSQSQLLHLLSTNIGNATNDMECIFDYHQHQYQLNNHNNFNNNINNNNVNNNNHSHNHIPVINTYCYTEAKHSMPPFQPIPIRVETVGVPCANPVGLISNFNSHTQLPSQQSMVSSHQTAQLSTLSSSLGFQNNNNCNNNNNNNKQSQQTQIHHQQQQHSSRQRVPSNPNSNISHFNQQYNMRSFPPYQSRQSQSSSSIESNGANYLQHYDLTGCNYNMSQTQTQQHHQHQHQPIFSHPVNYNPNTPISFCPQPSTQQHPPINCNNNGNNSLNNNNNININNNNINNNSKYIGGNSINGCGHQVQYTGLQYPQISSAHMQGGYFYQPIPATNIVTSSRFLPYSSTPNSVTDIFGPANDNTSPHLNQPYPLLHSDEMIIPRSTPQLHQQQHQQALGHSNFLGFGSNNAHPHNMGVQHSYIPWIEQHDSHIYGNNISSSHFQCLPEIHSSNLNTYPASTLFYPVMALQSAS